MDVSRADRSRDQFSHDLLKVVVPLPEDWHGHATETLWAKPVDGDRFALHSVPFYAKDLSFGDIVLARRDKDRLVVTTVTERSGHSTYRLLFEMNANRKQFLQYWEPLEKIGCTYERATDQLIAVDVPPEVDVYAAYDLLEAGEADGTWTFEEGHCGHVSEEQ